MSATPTSAPSFDGGWLDELVATVGGLQRGAPRLEDLYLERRLEVRARVLGGTLQLEHLTDDGAAVRWRFPSRSVLTAGTGTSPHSVARLLGRWGSSVAAPSRRAQWTPPLAPPPRFPEWVEALAARLAPRPTAAVLLQREATVVRGDGWWRISAPTLVRVHLADDAAALLAVWQHPRLEEWTEILATAAPARRWRPPSGEQLPVVFAEGSAGALVHELVGHLLEADAGGTASPLNGLDGATISTSSLDVDDDPTRDDLPGAFSCDDEGVLAATRSLVTGGVVAGWLADRASAAALGLPPGRGRRPSWRHPPSSRLSNLVTRAGEVEPDDLERDLRRGLVVTRVAGATVDPVTSRTLVRVERGWEVRHGRRRRALAPCELTGSALEILARIDPAVGADRVTDWRLGWCVKDGLPLPTGTETPTLLVHLLEVL